MRPREEIVQGVCGWNDGNPDVPMSTYYLQNAALTIEVLLDIRDLLTPRKNAITHPPSPEPPAVFPKGPGK